MKQSARIMIAVLAAMPALAAACVDAPNGTYCEQSTDIVLAAHGRTLKLVRHYNSGKAGRDGWFGHGWGTAYEARLTVLPDGSMQLDNPAKNETEYYAAPRIEGGKTGPARSTNCTRASVVETGNGYRRTACNGDTADFDAQGRLESYCEARECKTMRYIGERPDSIIDSAGQVLLLGWDADGHLARVHTDSGDPVAEYEYADGNLVAASVPAEGSPLSTEPRWEHRYAYDAQHRLTQIGEGSTVSYDASGRVSEMRNFEGLDRYEYRADPEQPELHFRVARIRDADDPSSARRYEAEYFREHDETGKPTLRRVVKTRRLGQDQADEPQEASEEILLDAQERVIGLRRSSGEFAEYQYEPRFGKVVSVTTNEGRRVYRYDARGQLKEAKDSDGRRVTLDYDKKGQIVRMTERGPGEKTKVLSFVYNKDGKPVRIRLAGKGEIRVKYKLNCEISDVSSKQGPKMALAVTQAFQSLLSLVKQPSVSLCP